MLEIVRRRWMKPFLYGWAAASALLFAVVLGASVLAGECRQTLECSIRPDGSCAPGPCDVRWRHESTVLGFAGANLIVAVAGVALVLWRRDDGDDDAPTTTA